MLNRMRILDFLKSSHLVSDWISAIRIPRKNCDDEISFASRNIDVLLRQLPAIGAASLCYMVLLAYKYQPAITNPETIWIAVNVLVSLPMLMMNRTLSKRLRANPIRSVKEICIATAAVGFFWGSADVFGVPVGQAASLALFVMGLVILSALPTAQLVFLASFIAGRLFNGIPNISSEAIVLALFFSVIGIWASAQARFSRSEAELALHRSRFARLTDQNNTFSWKTGADGNLHHASELLLHLIDKQKIEATRSPLWCVSQAEPDLNQDQQYENQIGFDMLKRCHNTQSSFSDVVLNLATTDGIHRLSLSGCPRHDASGGFRGFSGAGIDLTDTSLKQEKLLEAAERDGLTKLMNRACFMDKLEGLLSPAESGRCATAILLIDLDKFKQANDTLGHQTGDQILRLFADRLGNFINSRGFAARLGGDEFGVALFEISNKDKLAVLADELIANLSAPYSIGGLNVSIGATIGISIAPENGNTVNQLLRNADLALYSAKARGGKVHRFFDRTLLDHATERRRLEIDLKSAIEKGEISVVYQPIVSSLTERLCGFEALARWVHPIRGEVAPEEFIPLAESMGLVDKIGEWVLQEACTVATQWPAPIWLAVNVSPKQFIDPRLITIVKDCLGKAGLAPNRLELEITEGVFLEESASTQAILHKINDLGVRWALDDFGTGYSSLKYLINAPFAKIKIDREFISGVSVPGSHKRAIVGTIVSLAKILKMDTTAEGVESINDLRAAKELGCTQIQGFVYGPQLTAAEAQSLTKSRIPMPAEGFEATRSETRQVVLRSAEIVHNDKVWSGTVRNVSSRGAMIESKLKPNIGDHVELHMDHEKPRTGIVCWVREFRFGMMNDAQVKVELRELEAEEKIKAQARAA